MEVRRTADPPYDPRRLGPTDEPRRLGPTEEPRRLGPTEDPRRLGPTDDDRRALLEPWTEELRRSPLKEAPRLRGVGSMPSAPLRNRELRRRRCLLSSHIFDFVSDMTDARRTEARCCWFMQKMS